MTSAEFVAKYKLFKPIAERGARSFLAQEVQGHRAVLVHRLDIAPPDENRRLLGSLESIRPDERGSVIEVTEVDGIAIVVTRFTPDFHDLPSWLAQREQPRAMARNPEPPTAPPPSSGFTSAFSGLGIAAAPPAGRTTPGTTPAPGSAPEPQAPPVQPPLPAATPPAPGEFTQLFKGMAAAPGAPATPEPFRDLGARTPPIAPPPPRSDSSWPPAQPISATPSPSWATASPAPPQPMAPSAQPPIPQPPPFSPAPPPAPPPPAPAPPPSGPARGEFTQLFQGFSSPSAPASSAPPFAGPPAPPSFGSPSAPSTSSPGGLTPPGIGDRPSIMGPPGPPTFTDPTRSSMPPAGPPPPPMSGSFGAPPPMGGSFGAPPPFGGPFGGASALPPLSQGGGPPMPPPLSSGGIFGAPPASPPPAPATFPPSTLPGMAPIGGSSAGASEFTRMLGAIAPPTGPAAPPPMPIAPPPAAPPATGGQQSGGGSIKAYLPLILGLNVVLIALAAVILYFLLRR